MSKCYWVAALTMVAVLLAGAGATASRAGDFPGYGSIPKDETGAARFLAAHPEYDGRGVVVAIFDTGVDPGAPGLQVTSDGKPKIVDIVDGSGSGDVDTSTVVKVKDGVLKGLSGRELKINPRWTNPTGEYHLGLKRAYELFPAELAKRVTTKRNETWDAAQRAAVTAAERELDAWDAAHPRPTAAEREARAELAARRDQLGKLQDGFEDPGPLFDCVVFHDGQVWQAAIDTNEDGNLADEKLMTDYHRQQQWATFGQEDLMNYAVNIYADGNLLSIVCDSGMHGTHVAGIVAAHFPDSPDLDGLAPGAQLVAVKIGDTRLGGTGVGTGEVRGCIAVLRDHCDLINMSFGGPTSDPDHGRTIEIYSDIVRKHNIIFVSSAGNEGPCLTTTGAPGSTTSALFGIGAYISPQMQEIQYSLRAQTPPRQYTFTSRGPTADGDLGIMIAAPGGAISPVPNWNLQGRAQAHGTSMASPNACGSIALLLSGMKAENRPYTPVSVRRALENTAAPVPDVNSFALGHGLLQVDRAWDYLCRYADASGREVRFDVRVPARGNARGIYLREPWELDCPMDVRVMVNPAFPEPQDNRSKVNYELHAQLRSTARWIECADTLVVPAGGRRLDVQIDPTRLPPGAHYAEIQGFDADNPERGPMFRIPVTVVRPEPVAGCMPGRGPGGMLGRTAGGVPGDEPGPSWRRMIHFAPGQEDHFYLIVPEGATWADLHVRRLDHGEGLCALVTHAVQLAPGYGYHEHEFQEHLRVAPETEEIRSFPVLGGRTLELCLAEYTGYLGDGEVEVTLEFHGLEHPSQLFLAGGELATRFDVTAPLRKERVEPYGALDTLRKTFRPTKAEIRPLDGERDLLPEQRQICELVLTYEFTLDKQAKVTPHVALSRFLEEKTWQSRMYMLFDAGRRLITVGWLTPGEVGLPAGDYVLRYHVRHDDVEALESLKESPLELDFRLGSPVSLAFYPEDDAAAVGHGRFEPRALPAGEQTMLYVGHPRADKVPELAAPGDLLVGRLTLGRLAGRTGDNAPASLPVYYTVPPRVVKPAAEAAEEPAEPASEKGTAPATKPGGKVVDKVAEALRDAKVAQLKRLYAPTDRARFNQLANELLADDPHYLPVLLEELRRAEHQRGDDLHAVVDAADSVIEQIDRAALAAFCGAPPAKEEDAAKAAAAAKHGAEMDEQKSALILALRFKVAALLDLAEKLDAKSDARHAADEVWEQAFAELQRWTDTTKGDCLAVHVHREILRGRLGTALELLNGEIRSHPTDRAKYEQRLTLLQQLGWEHWVGYEQQWLLLRFPERYPSF